MNLKEAVWDEKYEPKNFKELICDEKVTIQNFLKQPKAMPSFLFQSKSPGTGKTTTAKLIARTLDCDFIKVNASKERGIDTIRDQVRNFAEGMSMLSDMKRCVFLDEADGLTKQAQEAMKGVLDDYRDNCFFILGCNDFSKIIEPLRSRCVMFDFDHPGRLDIKERLQFIADNEKLSVTDEELEDLIRKFYPDIRHMILSLQEKKIGKRNLLTNYTDYDILISEIEKKNLVALQKAVYEDNLDLIGFTKYFFRVNFRNAVSKKINLTKAAKCGILLADIEKSNNLGINLEVVFLANMVEIMNTN